MEVRDRLPLALWRNSHDLSETEFERRVQHLLENER